MSASRAASAGALFAWVRTLADELGPMLQPDRGRVRPGDMENLGLGSILSSGGSAPVDNTPLGSARMTAEHREA